MAVDKKTEEIGEKIKGELLQFLGHLHEEYGIGHGCVIIELNDDVTLGSLFGDIKTFTDETETRLFDCAKDTILGGAKEAKKQFDERKKEIAEKITDIVEDLFTLDEKKEKTYELAVKSGIIVDNKVNYEELAKFVKRTSDKASDYKEFEHVLEDLCEEHAKKDKNE